MAAIDTLHELADARGLVVLLEHPGVRWRLAVQTSRDCIRAGKPFLRRYVAMTEPTTGRIEEAARALLDELAAAPPTTQGE